MIDPGGRDERIGVGTSAETTARSDVASVGWFFAPFRCWCACPLPSGGYENSVKVGVVFRRIGNTICCMLLILLDLRLTFV